KDWKMAKLMNRWHHHHFNLARAVAQKPPKGVRIHTISPENPLPVSLVTTNANKLKEAVNLGVSKGEEIGKLLLKLFTKNQNSKKDSFTGTTLKQTRNSNLKKKPATKRKKSK
ncbi:DUF6363 domain-containing protein, partial [Leptospira interrogans]